MIKIPLEFHHYDTSTVYKGLVKASMLEILDSDKALTKSRLIGCQATSNLLENFNIHVSFIFEHYVQITHSIVYMFLIGNTNTTFNVGSMSSPNANHDEYDP